MEEETDPVVKLARHVIRMNELNNQRIMNLWYMVLTLFVAVIWILLSR